MASKPRKKMTQSERAKQFMPFSALTGLEEALHAVEEQIEQQQEPGYEGDHRACFEEE